MHFNRLEFSRWVVRGVDTQGILLQEPRRVPKERDLEKIVGPPETHEPLGAPRGLIRRMPRQPLYVAYETMLSFADSVPISISPRHE